MQLGLIGLGRMGANMARRWLAAGHTCVGYARDPADAGALARRGIGRRGSRSRSSSRLLQPPRAIWIMIPAAAVDGVIDALDAATRAGDTVIDGGNSHFVDDVRRAAALGDARRALSRRRRQRRHLRPRAGLLPHDRRRRGRRGAAHSVVRVARAGRPPTHRRAPAPPRTATCIAARAAPATSSRWCTTASSTASWRPTPKGSTCCVKRTPGTRAARVDAETAPRTVQGAHLAYDFDLAAIAELWRHGSVVRSWLLDLTSAARSPATRRSTVFLGEVSDSGEGRWTVNTAVEAGVPVPVLATALFARFSSRNHDDFANRLLSAMRREFGGHLERTAAPTQVAGAVATEQADALVVFGVTGDLAHKKIFPALQGLVKHGMLDVPVIGVARGGSGLEGLRERIRDSLEASDDGIDEAAFARLVGARALRRRRLPRAARRSPLCARRSATPRIRCTTWRCRRACSRPSPTSCASRAPPTAPASSWRSRSAATSLRRSSSTTRCIAASPSSPSIASTTTSARSRCRTCCSSASRTRSSSRSGTAITSTTCRSRWPRASASAAAASSTRKSARFATSCRTTCCRSSRTSRWSRPSRRRRLAARREGEGVQGDPHGDARRPRPRPVSRLPRRGRRRAGLERRDVRRPAPRHRFVALGRRALLSSRRQAPRHDGDRGRRDVEAAAAATCFRATTRRTTCASASGPTRVAIALGAVAKRPGPEMRGPRDRARSSATRAHDEVGAYERLIGAALARRPRRCSRARTACSRRGASSIRCCARAPRRSCTSPARRAPRRPMRSSAASGGWRPIHDDVVDDCP